MSALRDEIRAILREEISALRSESPAAAPSVERVRVSSSADLTRFAQDLIRRAGDTEFCARVARGELVFELSAATAAGGPIVSGPPQRQSDTLDKTLITERDIATISPSARSLRIAPHSRLTPLARDEARRRGIRIERTER